MKDPNLSELVRTCIRCWLYLVPQAFLGMTCLCGEKTA